MRRPRTERLFERAERGEHPPHPQIGIHSLLEPAAVGRAAFGLHRDPGEPLVGQAHVQLGRFRDDRAIRPHPGQEVPDPETLGFLVRDPGNHQIAAEPEAPIAEQLHRGETGGQTALHVVCAAAVQPAVPDFPAEWIGHSLDPDRVVMAVEHEGRAPAGPRNPAGHAHPPRRRLVPIHLGAELREPGSDVVGGPPLVGRPAAHRGIDRVDADQPREYLAAVPGIRLHQEGGGEGDAVQLTRRMGKSRPRTVWFGPGPSIRATSESAPARR